MATTYKDLADSLRREILSGMYAPGMTLPRIGDLADRHGMNVKTARRAIAQLESEGLVTPIRRRGTVVRERRALLSLGIDRYARYRWRSGGSAVHGASSDVIYELWEPADLAQQVRLVPADAEVSAGLGLTVGGSVYERRRLVRGADGTPTHEIASYYRPQEVAGSPLAADGARSVGSGFAVLAGLGLEPDQITETLHARMPNSNERSVLALLPGTPVMVLNRYTTSATGTVIEFVRCTASAATFAWTYTFAIPA